MQRVALLTPVLKKESETTGKGVPEKYAYIVYVKFAKSSQVLFHTCLELITTYLL